MKHRFSFLLFLLFTQGILFAQFRASEDVYINLPKRYEQYVGKTVPNCQLMDSTGNVLNLYDFDKKLIVLDFWATWCSPCISSIPITNSIYQQLKTNGYTEIEWIYVSVDTDTAKWKEFIESHEMCGYSLLTGEEQAKRSFQINGYPTYILIDTKKKIIGFDIQKPNKDGVLMEYILCDAYDGIPSGSSLRSAFVKGDDGYYYPSQKFENWNKKYISVYNVEE